MPFDMHRIFCATPFELEDERNAFYQVMSEFNEAYAMPRGILLVSVSLVPQMADKRPYQAAVNDNIKASRYYIQLIEDSWGPPERNMERDYALAVKYCADPESNLKQSVLLCKKPLLPHRVEPEIVQLKSSGQHLEFDTIDEFKQLLRNLFEGWLESIPTTA